MDGDRLTALEGMAGAVDDENSPERMAEEQAAKKAEEQAAQFDDIAREWGAVAYMIGSALSVLAPELRQVYTEDACMKWGAAVVPVAQKYGWDGPTAVPEFGLVIATAGLAVPSFLVIRKRLQDARKTAPVDVQARPVDEGQGGQGVADGVGS